MIGLLAWLALPAALAQDPAPAEVPALSADARAKLLGPVAAAAATGNRDEASRLLVQILGNPSQAGAHGTAWAMLAPLLEGMDLPLASVAAWGKAIAMDPDTAASGIETALDLAERTGEARPIARALGGNLGITVAPELRNRVSYVAARYHLSEANYGPALGILMMADATQPQFEDIELLRGVVLSQQQRYEDAIAPMLTAEAMAHQVGRDARFINRANLNLARAYYASGNYTQAIQHYAAVERSSEVWLTAQFERAWAHFRGNDTNGVLAMLYSHQSPFFEDYFNPEADLLRAYALFIMCKFPQATLEIDAFQARWEPIRDDYASIVMSPAEAFADVAAYLSGETPTLPISMLRHFRYEDRMAEAVRAVEASVDEIDRARSIGGPLGTLAVDLVEDLRDERIAIEGQRVLDRVEAARGELEQMLTDIEITRLDLLSLEAEMYQRAAASGVLDYGDHIGQLRDMRKKRRGFRVWPWQGEYWADEVGWYVFNARPDCPESMATGPE